MSGTAAARLHLHEARMRIRIFLFDGNESCLSKISVRQAKGLPTASFRFRLTMDILAVQLCASSLPARTRDLHLLEPAHDWRTKKAPAKPALCAVSLLLLLIIIIILQEGRMRRTESRTISLQGIFFSSSPSVQSASAPASSFSFASRRPRRILAASWPTCVRGSSIVVRAG